VASDMERRQAAMRAFADPVVQAQLLAMTRKLSDREYMDAVRRQMRATAELMADEEFWAAYRRSVVSVMSTVADPAFWAGYRRSVVSVMSALANPDSWATFREQLSVVTTVLSDPELASALRRNARALSTQNATYSHAVREALRTVAQQLADPALARAIGERLASTSTEQEGTDGRDGLFPVEIFANFMFGLVFMLFFGMYVGEANRSGQSLTDANRIDLTSSTFFGLSIAWSVRLLILKAGNESDS
jgi:hypothetical protein